MDFYYEFKLLVAVYMSSSLSASAWLKFEHDVTRAAMTFPKLVYGGYGDWSIWGHWRLDYPVVMSGIGWFFFRFGVFFLLGKVLQLGGLLIRSG